MDKQKFILKLVREVMGYIILGSIVLTTIIMYNGHGALPDALAGALITGGVSGIIAIALNSKSATAPVSYKELG